MMDKQEWLNGLKAGDEVAIMRGGYGMRIDTVDRLTKTLIVLGCGLRFRRVDGEEVGDDIFKWRMYPCTDEHRLVAVRRETRDIMKHAATGPWSLAKCLRVIAAIQSEDLEYPDAP